MEDELIIRRPVMSIPEGYRREQAKSLLMGGVLRHAPAPPAGKTDVGDRYLVVPNARLQTSPEEQALSIPAEVVWIVSQSLQDGPGKPFLPEVELDSKPNDLVATAHQENRGQAFIEWVLPEAGVFKQVEDTIFGPVRNETLQKATAMTMGYLNNEGKSNYRYPATFFDGKWGFTTYFDRFLPNAYVYYSEPFGVSFSGGVREVVVQDETPLDGIDRKFSAYESLNREMALRGDRRFAYGLTDELFARRQKSVVTIDQHLRFFHSLNFNQLSLELNLSGLYGGMVIPDPARENLLTGPVRFYGEEINPVRAWDYLGGTLETRLRWGPALEGFGFSVGNTFHTGLPPQYIDPKTGNPPPWGDLRWEVGLTR